jgi:hypothetical protein
VLKNLPPLGSRSVSPPPPPQPTAADKVPEKQAPAEPSPEYSFYGYTGLQNLGNTCYMNAAIQCLVNLTDLRDYFIGKKFFLKRKQFQQYSRRWLNYRNAGDFPEGYKHEQCPRLEWKNGHLICDASAKALEEQFATHGSKSAPRFGVCQVRSFQRLRTTGYPGVYVLLAQHSARGFEPHWQEALL